MEKVNLTEKQDEATKVTDKIISELVIHEKILK